MTNQTTSNRVFKLSSFTGTGKTGVSMRAVFFYSQKRNQNFIKMVDMYTNLKKKLYDLFRSV